MGKPPVPACLSLLWWQKAQEIDLLPIWATSENTTVEAVPNSRMLKPCRRAGVARNCVHAAKEPGSATAMNTTNEVQGEPKWLCPGLEAADEGDAVGHKRNDHKRAHT